jgi:RNA polymerase sigma factor (TIGR02999 family)
MPPADEEPSGPRLAGSAAADEMQRRQALLASLYAELHRRAHALMRHQRPDHTLQTTALVNEVCVRLLARERLDVSQRDALLALAATAMRCVLVDHARSLARRKRRPPGQRVPLDDLLESLERETPDLLALDEALTRLAVFDPAMARAVELRFFAGLGVEETARLLDMSRRTFERHWTAARAWLKAELG